MTTQLTHQTADKLDELSQLAELSLSQYGPAFQGEVSLLTHSENSTYVVTSKSGMRYVMRVHRTGYHSEIAIASELAWLAALAGDGIEVPVAIAGLNGDTLQQVSHPSQGTRSVVLFHWIDGSEPNQRDLIPSFRRLGMMTAKLHAHSRQWKRPGWFERPIWTHETMVCDNAPWGRWQEAPFLDDNGRAVIGAAVAKICAHLKEYGNAPELFGLIHADLRLTNLLVEGAETRIIDFDDCGFAWLMHDLAAAMSFFEHHPDLGEWVKNWLKGYHSLASINANDIAAIPTLITQRRIQLLAWTGTHQGTPQADGLGSIWVDQTVELCQKYLDGTFLPQLASFMDVDE